MSLSFGSAAGKKKWEKITDAASFTEDDYEDLARHDVNGRQVRFLKRLIDLYIVGYMSANPS